MMKLTGGPRTGGNNGIHPHADHLRGFWNREMSEEEQKTAFANDDYGDGLTITPERWAAIERYNKNQKKLVESPDGKWEEYRRWSELNYGTEAAVLQFLSGVTIMGGGIAANAINGTYSTQPKNQSQEAYEKDVHEAEIAEGNRVTGINRISLPKDPSNLLRTGWKDITPTGMKNNTSSRMYENLKTGETVRFDLGAPNATGFAAQDHYHRINPDATGKGDYYLDKNGSPVPKNSKASHIFPED